MPLQRTITGSSDPSQDPFGDVEHISNVNNSSSSRTSTNTASKKVNEITDNDIETLKHFRYVPETDKLEADRAIETTLNSLFLGEQHKMSSGSENIYFTNLSSDINFYPAWGGLKDQSVLANQDSSGLLAPTGRVFGDYAVFPSGGQPIANTAAPYDASSYYPNNISGLSIGVILAEDVSPEITLRYNISVNGNPVYEQILEHNGLSVGEFKEWFFDHPLDVRGGSTNTATITKVQKGDVDVDLGRLMVEMGDNGENRYHVSVGSRSFEDKTIAYADDLDSLDIIGSFNIYVNPLYVGGNEDGTNLRPFSSIANAVSNSNEGDSILVKGDNIISAQIEMIHGLRFYGVDDATIRYASYNSSNDDLFYFAGSDNTKEFLFNNITFKNAGGYGVYIKKAKSVEITDCTFTSNGWTGGALNTVAPSASSGLLGYDSSQADLQAFYAGPNASNGGAMRIESSTGVRVIGNNVSYNLRGIRIQDCGIGGYGFVTRNVSSMNIESGIYLAASVLGGCQNIVVSMNASSYNANNGLLCIGGINNKFSQNEVNGNWNAGFCGWGSSNLTMRDSGLYDNNRSQYNGIGNIGDAKASIQINDVYDIIGDNINFNPAFRFIAEILDCQVHYTGLGSNTEKIGFLLGSSVGNLPANEKNIIKIDDVGFIGQDYCIDFSECDLTTLEVALGDNSFMSVGEKAINPPVTGDYFELPFSNHITNLNYADFSVDNTGNIKITEGANGARLNPYRVNDIEAIADGTKIKVILKDSKKVQFTVPVSGCSVDGSYVNSVLNLALVQLNDLFTNTVGFASGGNPVTDFTLVSNDLTLTLEDGTSFTVDVTSLGVSSDNFVVAGNLFGSDLVLTMDDSSTVTIDAQNMINGHTLSSLGTGWYIAYGTNAGNEITNPTSGNNSYNNAPLFFGDKLEVGQEFVWTQYHLVNHASRFMTIGVWDGITSDASPTTSTLVTNWSTKFGFFYNRLTEDTSTLANGGYSSKNTDLGSGGAVYDNGAYMRLVYGSDYKLRIYANDELLATSIIAETGDDLDIHITTSNNGIEFPNFSKRTSNWSIVHDLDSSENNDILNGIEEDTVLETNFEIELGEKAMVDLSGFGRSHRIGLNYIGAASGNSNPYTDFDSPIVYGTSEQIIAQNSGEWTFNSSSIYYTNTGNGKWNVPSSNAGMVSFRYHSDSSVDLYSETYKEVIATKLTNLDGSAFKVAIAANEDVTNINYLHTISKQTIGQSFQPRTNYAPTVVNQTVNVTEGDNLNFQIVSSDYIVNQYVAENAPSWMIINQTTGVLSGIAPAYVGDATDNIVVNCKAGNAVGGVTNFTVTVNVLENTYVDTKSLKFRLSSNAYLTGLASNVTALQRAANGSGASDAWSISMWVKTGGGSSTQQLFHYGGNTTYTAGAISLMQQSLNDLVFVYGTAYNNIVFVCPNTLIANTWTHILVTYDGGTTGVSSGSLSDYYSRFNCVINGNIQSPTFSHTNNGYSGSINAVNYFVGRGIGGVQKLKDATLNELAIWDSNEFANKDDIYNSGVTHDLSLLSSSPAHLYQPESSITTVTDSIGNADLTGFNFISSDLVSDTP